MATVTGMTAAAMIAIRDQTIIGAEINGSGHLILTKYDESTIDAGSITDAVDTASDTVAGVVELATSAETTTGTDATRAVTPAGLMTVTSTKQPLDDDLTAIASIAPANDDFIQRKSGIWVNRTLAQVSSDLSATLLPKTGGTMSGSIFSVRSASTDTVLGGSATGDGFDRVRVYADGKYEAGPGTGSRDTNFYRASAGLWKTDHSWEIVNDLTVGDTLTVTGPIAGASNLNMGAWTTFTPTWTAATTNPVLGNGTLIGRYMRVGRKITYHINLVTGSTTTYGSGIYSWALPVAAANVGCTYIGNAHILGANRWNGQFLISPGATSASPSFPESASVFTNQLMTNTRPETHASGTQLRITGEYEAAS